MAIWFGPLDGEWGVGGAWDGLLGKEGEGEGVGTRAGYSYHKKVVPLSPSS